MLGKLIKYEFKATYKFMLLLYGILLVLSLFMGFGRINNIGYPNYNIMYNDTSAAMDFIKMFVAFLFGAMMFVVITVVFFFYINRFRKNMLGDSGYLYHTLPVKAHDHILAKCISAVFWTFISFIVAIAAYFVMLAVIYSESIWDDFYGIVQSIISSIGDFVGVLRFVQLIIILFMIYLMIFASMAVGYSSNSHRAAKSIGVFVLITFVIEFIVSLVDEWKLCVFSYPHYLEGIYPLKTTIAIDIAVSVVFAVALFFITRYFLKNKLNLQ